jgi:hypothetical protein
MEPLESPTTLPKEDSPPIESSIFDQPCGFFTDWHRAMSLGNDESTVIRTEIQGQETVEEMSSRFAHLQRNSDELMEPLESSTTSPKKDSPPIESSIYDQPCGFFTDWHRASPSLGNDESTGIRETGEEISTMPSEQSTGGLSQTFSLFPRTKKYPEDGSYIL